MPTGTEKYRAIIAVIALLLAISAYLITDRGIFRGDAEKIDISDFISLKAGSIAPDFEFRSINGGYVSMSKTLRSGKAVLIQTMAPGCISCAASLSKVPSVYDKYSSGTRFIGFNVGTPDDGYLEEYVDENGFVGDYVTPDAGTLKNYGIISTDILYVVGKDRVIKKVIVPPRSADEWEAIFKGVV